MGRYDGLEYPILKKFYKQLEQSQQQLFIDGLDQSGRDALLELLIENDPERQYVILCENDRRVNGISHQLRSILQIPVLSFYQQSHLPVEVLAKEEDNGDSVYALYLLSQRQPCVIVINAMSLFDRYPRPDYFMNAVFSLSVGDVVTQEEVLSRLVTLGYDSVSICDQPGLLAKRGGIVDVYSPDKELPLRIEWFDDEIDSIRYFSAEDQKSQSNIDSVTLLPAKAEFFTEQVRSEIVAKIQQELTETLKHLSTEVKEQLSSRLSQVSKHDVNDSLLHYYAYLATEFGSTLFDYISDECLIIVDETEVVEDVMQEKHQAILDQLGELFEFGYILPSKIEDMQPMTMIREGMQGHRIVCLSEIKNKHSGLELDSTFYYPVKANPLKAYPVNRFIEDIKRYLNDVYRLIFYGKDSEVVEVLENLFKEYGIRYKTADSLEMIAIEDQVVILKRNYIFECEFSSDRCIIMNANVFNVHAERAKTAPKKRRASLLIEDLQVGDYIVHEKHGIGLYLGIEHLTRGDIEKDYLLIQYKGADRLYVPIDQMHLVEKYVGQEGKRPKINKLGGTEWVKSKQRVKKSIEDMAEQLLEVHARRQMTPGFAFAPDDEMQHEFEDDFPYVETEDQLQAIKEVKADMERPTAMDRLVCGDVGFGKTEVALRAAFKAICNHKQVAILVPTTILAMQHFETFSKRMEKYGVEIAQLTRFCTTKEQNKIFKALENHRLDIVIGTHKLLNSKLHFADLGLLIIDEEQRFGVKHKEKLKSLQENVDVLTLSATPIPRTLYFSLTGVKDMSVIETPPDNRLPIQTYVMEELPMVIEQAVRRELLRGGQVFVVYNNVEHLSEIANKYRELFPNSRILMGHGRMKETELEDVMLKFQKHEADILVCTTIIETGIDMPNVNTLIVHNADHFGMAQLYQLKGRVGRSKRVAYAYLMYRPDKLLSEDQRKRLNTLREYTALGSGYKISMRDLEIRGSGNMLGAEQSGHVTEIGFELYLKMLQETIRRFKRAEHLETAPKKEPLHTEIDIDIKAFFPEDYISDTRLRIGLYQRLDSIMDAEALGDMYDELVDRFGMPPEPVQNLLRLVALKQLASSAQIISIRQRKNNVYIKIDDETDFDIQQLLTYVARSLGKIMLKNIEEETYVVMDVSKITNTDKLLDSLKLVLSNLKEIVSGENTQYNITSNDYLGV